MRAQGDVHVPSFILCSFPQQILSRGPQVGTILGANDTAMSMTKSLPDALSSREYGLGRHVPKNVSYTSATENKKPGQGR